MSTRPTRQVKPVERFKASKSTKPVNKPKPVEKATEPPPRTLDLTLKKFNATDYDITDPDSPFYTEYFTNPDDDIKRRLEALDYTKQQHTISLQSGITNYELKDINRIKLNPVLFSKFKDGDYETHRSKSDKRISVKIKSFTSKLPSFTKYRDQDDILWIVRDNRLLFCEILEHAIKNNLSASTIETELNAMMRVFYIALGTKNHPLYMKYQTIMKEMTTEIRIKENNNLLNETELKKGGLIPWTIVTNKQRALENQFNNINNKLTKEAYSKNLNLLVLSLYTLIPPLRNEIKSLEFTTDPNKTEGDYILFDNNDIYLDLNNEKKKHDSIKLELPDNLKKIIKESYDLYPRQYAFTDILKYPDMTKKVNEASVSNRLENLFKDTQYKVGTSMLRSSFITHEFKTKTLSRNQKLDIAKKMRTSIDMLEGNYFKIISEPLAAIVNIQDNDIRRPIANVPRAAVAVAARPVRQTKSTYEKHLIASRKYYDENKDKVLAKQQEYRAKNKMQQNKRKILYFLNNDNSYKDRIRKETLAKYDIQEIDGKYV